MFTIIEITFTLASSLTELGLTEALGAAGEDLETGTFIVMGTLTHVPTDDFSMMLKLFLKTKIIV